MGITKRNFYNSAYKNSKALKGQLGHYLKQKQTSSVNL
jgi:hypothetical protein